MSTIKDTLPQTINDILSAYNIDYNNFSWSMIHNGHINRTYVIEYKGSDGNPCKSLLQQINTQVFKNPVALMENVMNVTAFLKDKIALAGGDTARETLTVFFTIDGKNCYIDSNGSYWRMYNFVDNAFTYNTIESAELFKRAGAAFGNFQSQLADFPIDKLFDTIPNFHNTFKRFNDLMASVEKNASGRANNVLEEIEFAKNREEDTKVITGLLDSGAIPYRVTHNDTKLNNIMFDEATKAPICVVDLDTVMPGSALYDFGDAIRFGANTAAEDEKDISKVSLSLELYKSYVEGYLSTAGKSLNEKEIEYLPFSAKLLTLECGMRFLADYIDGDVYFSTAYDDHNLVRCKTQFALVADIEKKYDEMVKITMDAFNAI